METLNKMVSTDVFPAKKMEPQKFKTNPPTLLNKDPAVLSLSSLVSAGNNRG